MSPLAPIGSLQLWLHGEIWSKRKIWYLLLPSIFWLPFPNNFYGMDMRDNYKGFRKPFMWRARLVMSCFCHNSNLGRPLALQGQDLNSFQNVHLLLSASVWQEVCSVWMLVHQSLPSRISLWAESNSICMTFRLISYLHLSRVCASSNWFLRNRSRAAMQSSRASDRSDREHLGSRTSRAWLRQDEMLQKMSANSMFDF